MEKEMKSREYRKNQSRISGEKQYRRYLKRKGVKMELVGDGLEKKRRIEQDILTIEGMFFAINSATFQVKFMDAIKRGMEMMGQQHASLLAQMSPEELADMRARYNKPQTDPSVS